LQGTLEEEDEDENIAIFEEEIFFPMKRLR
jgi:hypothetical protein